MPAKVQFIMGLLWYIVVSVTIYNRNFKFRDTFSGKFIRGAIFVVTQRVFDYMVGKI